MNNTTLVNLLQRFFKALVYTDDLPFSQMMRLLFISCLFSAYIYFVYRLITRKTFFSKDFGIALAAVCVIVCSIIVTIQSSIVVTLGMVGSLSIVRFRTAVKEPFDLVFLFWSISAGIITGAGLPGVALAASAILTIGIFLLGHMPLLHPPMLLIVSADDASLRDPVMKAVSAHSKAHALKSQMTEASRIDMVIEVRTGEPGALIDSVSGLKGVTRCSLMEHTGEIAG